MTEKLKPCPFCGGEAHISKMGYPHWIYCENCGAKVHGRVVGEREGEKASIEAWNRRAEQTGWIKTSERLPEKEKEVLVYDKGFFSIGEVSEWNGGLKWWYCDESAEAELNEFPYWMPLPELPEEGEE